MSTSQTLIDICIGNIQLICMKLITMIMSPTKRQHLTSHTILKLAGSSASMNNNIPVHVYPLPSSRYPSWQEHW